MSDYATGNEPVYWDILVNTMGMTFSYGTYSLEEETDWSDKCGSGSLT